MSYFYNNPIVELIDNNNGGLWKLYAPLVYNSDLLGIIHIPFDFITDFASVPRIALSYLLVGNTAHAAAIVHDYLYRKDSTPNVSKDIADSVFKEAMETTSIPKWRQAVLYAGVRIGGSAAYHRLNVFDYPKQEEEIADVGRDQGTTRNED